MRLAGETRSRLEELVAELLPQFRFHGELAVILFLDRGIGGCGIAGDAADGSGDTGSRQRLPSRFVGDLDEAGADRATGKASARHRLGTVVQRVPQDGF